MTKPNDSMLLKANLKQLRLPTIGAEFEKLAREATASNQTFEQYLLRLTELEVATRQSNALATRIRQADFSVEKDLENFDFSASQAVNKQKVLELARRGPPCGRCPIIQRSNVCLLGQPGTRLHPRSFFPEA
jgi:DNA replication protein DnaC